MIMSELQPHKRLQIKPRNIILYEKKANCSIRYFFKAYKLVKLSNILLQNIYMCDKTVFFLTRTGE